MIPEQGTLFHYKEISMAKKEKKPSKKKPSTEVLKLVCENANWHRSMLTYFEWMEQNIRKLEELGVNVGDRFPVYRKTTLTHPFDPYGPGEPNCVLEFVDLYKGAASRWHSVWAERLAIREVKEEK
jgi:hypothetical protein